MLVKFGKSEYRYVPVTSRFKLNKKRNVQEEDTQSPHQQVQNIVIAPRGYSREEEKAVTAIISSNRNISVKLASDAIKFESRETVLDVERKAAPELKALFKVEVPKPSEQEEEEAVQDEDATK